MLRKVGGYLHIDLPCKSAKGGRFRKSTGTNDRKLAQLEHDKKEREIWEQEHLGRKPPVTWLQAVKKWADHKPRGLPERYLVKGFGFSEDALLPLNVESVTESLTGYSPSSWNRSLTIVASIHRTSGLEPPKVARKPVPPGREYFLTEPEFERLEKHLRAISPLLADAARFAVATGLRENNVLNLEWKQVDLKRRTAFLWADQMKNRAAHGVRLNDAALALLTSRRGIHKQFVFPNPETGLPLVKASNKSWYAAVKKAKLTGLRWHDLRHTWASWHVQRGTRIEELQKLGGWKSLHMVMRYAHLSTDHLADAAERVSGALTKS